MPLLGVEDGHVCGRIGQQVREQLGHLRRREVRMIERRSRAKRKHGVLPLKADDLVSMDGEILSSGARRHDRRRDDQLLERPQPDAVHEPRQVEVPEDLALGPVDALPKAVGEERIACESLHLLHQEAERQRGVVVVWRGGWREALLGCYDESADEMEVGFDSMGFGKLFADRSWSQ